MFHSVSATNNAGFDIFPGESLSYFVNSFPIQIVFAIQFILGGIGFIVFLDI
ncbi:MAG: potassium transporter TrkG [Mollicutes bacterium]|nr:MAG: potassium transporter TrkG [Mollicutes bacterium]